MTSRVVGAAPVVVGGVVGWFLGMRWGFADSTPSAGSLLPASFLWGALIALVLAGVGLPGLLLSLRPSTRRAGRMLLLATAGGIAGFPFGLITGPRYEPPRVLPGTVVLELSDPPASLAAPATCTTEANGNRVIRVETPDLGLVGIDRLSMTLRVDDHGMAQIRINGRFGYEGGIDVSDLGIDATTGRASFVGIPAGSGDRIGGPNGSAMTTGTASWRCVPKSTVEPSTTAPVQREPLQGYFTLSGIVEVAESHATGTCSRDFELRTQAIETVVPWVGGRLARLQVAPGRETATLTVAVGDGSALETATAPAVLVERRSAAAPEVVGMRQLTSSFDLRDGRLELFVEWGCSDSLEGPQKP